MANDGRVDVTHNIELMHAYSYRRISLNTGGVGGASPPHTPPSKKTVRDDVQLKAANMDGSAAGHEKEASRGREGPLENAINNKSKPYSPLPFRNYSSILEIRHDIIMCNALKRYAHFGWKCAPLCDLLIL